MYYQRGDEVVYYPELGGKTIRGKVIGCHEEDAGDITIMLPNGQTEIVNTLGLSKVDKYLDIKLLVAIVALLAVLVWVYTHRIEQAMPQDIYRGISAKQPLI